MSDFVIGQIRTWVPIGVGVFLAWLVSLGIQLDASVEAGLIPALTGLLGGLYYLLITTLAKKWPGVGILLGVNKAPEYSEN